LRILKEIAEALNGAANVDQALRDSLARVADLLGLGTGWVWLIDPQTGRFYSATAQALPPFLSDPVRMTGSSCWCIEAYRSGRLAAENIDVIECSRLRAALGAEQPETRGLRYHASIPLYFGDRQLGIMNVATPRWRRLTPRELDLLSTIASQLGMAIERARLAEESVRLARLEERTRLARDLHDTLTQGLTAIGLHIDAAMSAMGRVENNHARRELERALTVTRSSLDEARRSLRELRTSPLAGRPLAEALVSLGREMASTTGIRVHVRSADGPVLSSNTEEELYRIATEALTNIRRHAHANEVHVTLARAGRHARLTIADDGAGFDVRGRRARSNGYGLAGMRERSALVGGRLVVRSRPGHGTQITVDVPLDQAQDEGRGRGGDEHSDRKHEREGA
jgi:two-component system NarL family sensor kinase